jgi:hypothetical protein
MDRQYVGIDFHRRRSVIVRKNAAGEKSSSVQVVNDPWAIAAAIAEAGPEPEVVIELLLQCSGLERFKRTREGSASW